MDYINNFTLLGLIYLLFFYRKWNKRSKHVLIINTLMYVYIVMVLFVTLMPFSLSLGLGQTNPLFWEKANFIPFRDLILHYGGAEREIVLNILMMIPFGFLYPVIKGRGIFKTLIMTFLFSLAIECSQLLGSRWGGLVSRTFDVTDLITNTFGGLVGYIYFIGLKPLIDRIIPSNE
ncbi:VanZ family protein [Cerasibacillus terrae]|uniref:VanZ family protein n=1 Tax=Cerasibacillus terrae TaxID=2498845 RepID=A0A5C8NMD0_9BACI|nr:VanZ family protein [Cerasibacillus terrae]TXL61623.1 VanZ family protein [Cerasibacillus terrae]